MAKKICKEKECEACGAWFTPSRSNVKYCPNCRTHSDQIVRQMERNTQRNMLKDMQRETGECVGFFVGQVSQLWVIKDLIEKRLNDMGETGVEVRVSK